MRLPALDYAFGVVAKLPLKVDRLRCITIFGEPWGLVKSIWQVEPFGVRACLASQLVKWHLSAQVLFKLDSEVSQLGLRTFIYVVVQHSLGKVVAPDQHIVRVVDAVVRKREVSWVVVLLSAHSKVRLPLLKSLELLPNQASDWLS